jgi:hypothetical protein
VIYRSTLAFKIFKNENCKINVEWSFDVSMERRGRNCDHTMLVEPSNSQNDHSHLIIDHDDYELHAFSSNMNEKEYYVGDGFKFDIGKIVELALTIMTRNACLN